MSTGIVLLIIGAVFVFAFRIDGSWMNVHALGVILMLGGVAFIVRARMRRREVVVEDEADDGSEEHHEKHVVTEQRAD